MIKFAADITDQNDGEEATMIGIGLSFENIEKLKAGEPILFQTDELQIEFKSGGKTLNGVIFIMAGETEQKIVDEFREAGLLQI